MTDLRDGHLPVADRTRIRHAVGRLWRAERGATVAVVALYCATSLIGLAGPWLLGRIIDEAAAGTNTATIDRLAAAIVAFALLQLIANRFARYTAHRLGERTLARLRETFVERTLRLPTATVEKVGTGDLMTRSSSDVATIGMLTRQALPELFLAAVQVVFILTAVFLVSPLLGACALIAAPTLWWVTRWYLHRARSGYLAEGAANTEMSQALAETVEGARTMEVLRIGRYRIDTGDTKLTELIRTRRYTLFLRSVLFPVAELSYALPIAVVLLVGGLGYINGLVGLGAVVAATLYLQQLSEPLDTVLMWLEQLQRGSASFARVEGLAALDDDPSTTDTEPVDDRISLDGVRFAYRGGRDILHGVDLHVEPGEHLALVGPSGAGKSTLGKLLAGVERPHTGSITIGGADIADLPPEQLRQRVALVTQEHHIFIGTLRDNLILAKPDATDTQITAALHAIDADLLDRLPHGLDTELGPGTTTLDADAQHIALARLILANPHTLILDEATALLDPTTARRTERSLAAVLKGRTVVSIAHRLHTAHDADRIAVIDHGRIVELGSHEHLIAADGAYAHLWHTWHGDR